METAFRFGTSSEERLALIAHGALVTLHLLGVAYHTVQPRKDFRYALIHAAAAGFDMIAAFRHGKSISA